MSTLTWSKTAAGRYYARGERWAYVVQKFGREWRVAIYEHAIWNGGRLTWRDGGHETKALAVAVAEAHEQLGEGYRSSVHGYRSRFTYDDAAVYGGNR